MTSPTPVDLAELERTDLEAALAARGQQRFHAGQVFRWVYRRGTSDPAAMTDLSRALRQTLADEFALSTPALAHREKSVDGTEKFLLRLADGRTIESVFIPDTPSMTFCISTQVGCAMACAFCLTGKMGLMRNLTAGEIIGQVRILDDEHGFALPPRRVTLSTVGLLPALERLAQEPLMPNLAISLHAPTDALRGELVPLNRKYGVADIIDACKRFPLARRRRITFEYVLLAGVNDSP